MATPDPFQSAASIIKKAMAYMAKDTSDPHLVDIVEASEVTGTRQECDEFGHEFVDQSGPGISRDDYSGHVYLPFGTLYLKFWYWC